MHGHTPEMPPTLTVDCPWHRNETCDPPFEGCKAPRRVEMRTENCEPPRQITRCPPDEVNRQKGIPAGIGMRADWRATMDETGENYGFLKNPTVDWRIRSRRTRGSSVVWRRRSS